MSVDSATEARLLRLLGPEAFLRLVETHGGLRLYVPQSNDRTGLAAEIGDEATLALAARWGGFYIRVPLARAFRARHYRAAGLSNAQIARRLGQTEPGVNQLFARMADVPAKGSKDPRQLALKL